MEERPTTQKPSKQEQKTALKSYNALAATLEKLQSESPEIEIEETKERIKVPLNALKLLATILKETGQGRPISIVPVATEMTTQAAANFLGCSRPHLIKLLESGAIAFTKVGRHRRVKYEDLVEYKRERKKEQKRLLSEMMADDEKSGLYDS